MGEIEKTWLSFEHVRCESLGIRRDSGGEDLKGSEA
jgi:hypothetical protein